MKIASILNNNSNFTARKVENRKSSINGANLAPLTKDTVSFGARVQVPKEIVSENVQEATALAKRLFKLQRSNRLNLDSVSELINSRSPVPVEIKDLKDLPQEMRLGNYLAYLQPHFAEDFKLEKATMYLRQMPQDKKGQMGILANVAHEYTHLLQRSADDSYCGLKQYSQDLGEARFYKMFASRIASRSFNELNNVFLETPQWGKLIEKALKGNKQVSVPEFETTLGGPLKTRLKVHDIIDRTTDDTIREFVDNKLLDAEDVTAEGIAKLRKIAKEHLLYNSKMESEAHLANKKVFALDPGAIKELNFNNDVTRNLYEVFIRALS